MLWGNEFHNPSGILVKIALLCFANTQNTGNLVFLVCLFTVAKYNALVLHGVCSIFGRVRIMQMRKFLRHPDIFINTEQEN